MRSTSFFFLDREAERGRASPELRERLLGQEDGAAVRHVSARFGSFLVFVSRPGLVRAGRAVHRLGPDRVAVPEEREVGSGELLGCDGGGVLRVVVRTLRRLLSRLQEAGQRHERYGAHFRTTNVGTSTLSC